MKSLGVKPLWTHSSKTPRVSDIHCRQVCSWEADDQVSETVWSSKKESRRRLTSWQMRLTGYWRGEANFKSTDTQKSNRFRYFQKILAFRPSKEKVSQKVLEDLYSWNFRKDIQEIIPHHDRIAKQDRIKGSRKHFPERYWWNYLDTEISEKRRYFRFTRMFPDAKLE